MIGPLAATWIALDPHAPHAFDVNGNGMLQVSGRIVVNSDNTAAGFFVGNAEVLAEAIEFAGDYEVHGNASIEAASIRVKQTSILDPLRTLPMPGIDAMPVRTSARKEISKGNVELLPGIYKGGIQVSGKASVNLAPGIYVLDGGGFSVTGQASVTGAGVVLYNRPSNASQSIALAGTGTLNLSAPTSGTYKGIAMLQTRTGTAPIRITGGAETTISGMIYAPSALTSVKGIAAVTIDMSVISRTIEVRGNGDVQVRGNSSAQGCPLH